MPEDEPTPQLLEVEREKLLFLLGTYAFSIPMFEWNELAKHLEKFALDVAARHHREIEQRPALETLVPPVMDDGAALNEEPVAASPKRKKPMPEWEA